MGLREVFQTRGLPQATYPLRAVSSQELDDAEQRLSAARAALAQAEAERKVSTALRQAVDDAIGTVRGCYQHLTVRALPPAEMEAVVGEHPPTDEQREHGDPFNRLTLVPVLLGRCVFDTPDATEPALSEDEWAQQVAKGSTSLGEVAGLFNAVWQINDRTPDVSVPKGSSSTRS